MNPSYCWINDLTMKHVLLLITTVIAMAFHAVAPAYAQQNRTIKSEMEVIHKLLDVNFVYDSAIEINMPYSGKPMKDIIKTSRKGRSDVMPDSGRASFFPRTQNYNLTKA